MARARDEDARDVLTMNRQAALSYADHAGPGRVRELMAFAEQDLMDRIAAVHGGTFTEVNLNAMLRQVRLVTAQLTQQLTGTIVDEADAMSSMAAQGTVDYMVQADGIYRGVGTRPLALDEASIFDSAKMGARSSVLARLAGDDQHPAQPGIMQRYGLNTIGEFEKVLRVGVVTGKGIDQVKGDLTKASPFLQGKPGFWAERIARTELMGAFNRAGWESHRDVDEQLGGDEMVRILCATFDDRTAADSYAVHGQIRRPEEAFDTWYGPMQHPPARPNDREIVVPHRIAWDIPDYLKPMSPGAIAARWRFEGRKGSPPPRPLMTTVPLDKFGKEPEKKEDDEASADDSDLTEEQKAAKAANADLAPDDPNRVPLDPDGVPILGEPDPVAPDDEQMPGARRRMPPRERGPLVLEAFSDAEQSLMSDLAESLVKQDEAEEVKLPEPEPETGDKAGIAKALAKRGIEDVHPWNYGRSNSERLAKVFGDNVSVEHLEGLVSTDTHKAVLTEAFHEGSGVMVKYSLQDHTGEEVAMVQHRYDIAPDGERSMHLQNFFINEGHQGQGIGLDVMKKTINGMREQGMTSISLDAHAVGRYTWASFGFMPSNTSMVSRALMSHLTEKTGLAPEAAERITNAVMTKPGDLARLHIDGNHVGKEFLLAGPNWKGSLSLKDGDPGFEYAKKRLGL